MDVINLRRNFIISFSLVFSVSSSHLNDLHNGEELKNIFSGGINDK